MEPEFWHERWSDGRIGFHREGANPLLVYAWPTVAPPPGSRVLVPLAGKTHDLSWLRDQGMRVTGVELSPIACAQRYAEAGVTPTTTAAGPFVRWDGDVEMLQGDICDLPTDAPWDFAWDRGCTVALPPPLRDAYARKLAAAIRPGGTVLLVALDYPQEERPGPPFSIDAGEVHRLYGEAFTITRAPTPPGHAHPPMEPPTSRLDEQVWALVRRTAA